MLLQLFLKKLSSSSKLDNLLKKKIYIFVANHLPKYLYCLVRLIRYAQAADKTKRNEPLTFTLPPPLAPTNENTPAPAP